MSNIWVSPYCIHCYRKISGTVDAEAGSKVYLPASGYQSQCISDSDYWEGSESPADWAGTGMYCCFRVICCAAEKKYFWTM